MAIAMNQSMTSTMAQTMAIIMTLLLLPLTSKTMAQTTAIIMILSLLPLTSIMVIPKSEPKKVMAEPMLGQKESSSPRKQL